MTLTPPPPFGANDPIMAVVLTRTKRNYSIPKATIATQFLGGASVTAWDVEGRYVKARLADTNTPNNPVAGITRIVENYTLIPFQDIYQQYFTSIPGPEFTAATVSFTTNDMVIALNREE